MTVTDMSYAAYAQRLDPVVEQQRQAGIWQIFHPWFDVWLPDGQAEDFAGRVLSELTLKDTAAARSSCTRRGRRRSGDRCCGSPRAS